MDTSRLQSSPKLGHPLLQIVVLLNSPTRDMGRLKADVPSQGTEEFSGFFHVTHHSPYSLVGPCFP